MRLFTSDLRFLQLLKFSPFEQHAAGGWRFGVRRISDSVVDRLIASGRARREAGRIVGVAAAALLTPAAAPALRCAPWQARHRSGPRRRQLEEISP